MDAPQINSVLIVDDHPVYREALTERLASEFLAEGIEVFAGLAGIKVFNHFDQVAHVVAISGLNEHAWEPRSVAAGASLFLSKNNSSEYIIRKIRQLMTSSETHIVQNQKLDSTEYRLTQRQLEVLHLISLGHPNKVIADLLEIKEQTIKIHINQIFKELRVFNRTQAVLKAQKHMMLSAKS